MSFICYLKKHTCHVVVSKCYTVSSSNQRLFKVLTQGWQTD
jgi:hypothetical protein